VNNINKLLETKVELSDKQIHVFLLQLDLFNYDDFLFYLSEDESERAARLKVEEKKKQFVIVRGVLRKLLSNSLSKSSKAIKFSYGEHKKPAIEEKYNNKSVEFNISHSGNYALIAMTLTNKVGVDIEKINREINYQSLSNRFFSRKEKQELTRLNKDEQLDAFYRAWVRKESFIKATGKGIAYGLDQFSVSLEERKISGIELVSPNLIDEQWTCYDLVNLENYKTALTSCGKENNIIFHG
jgi:4'-phosphopantetheinyl transferase